MQVSKYVLAFLVFFVVFGIGYVAYEKMQNTNENSLIPNKEKVGDESDPPKHDSPFAKEDIISIVLLGIDRRSKSESSYRTDIMIVVTIDKNTNQVVMASIPRDLWWNGGRINAAYIQGGWPSLQEGLTEITGIKPEKFILTDFEDFSWIVDAMGGVPVEVATTFTDSQYPVDATFEYQTVSFNQGTEVLSGERALIFSRSRKGDNDNGDWGRMKRQHLILKGMLSAIKQPASMFKNMDPKEILKVATTGKMDTNLTPSDAVYFWDMYKDKDKYQITSLYLDHEYLFTPPMEEYGGAWVLAPIDGTFEPFKQTFKNTLAGIKPTPPTENMPDEANQIPEAKVEQ
jgi:LCP family protein required for cell wall assembly